MFLCEVISRAKGVGVSVQSSRRSIELAQKFSEIFASVGIHPNEASNVSDDGKIGGVIHCFSGNSDTAKKFLDLGFHISFAGPVTRKRKTKRAILS